MIYTFIYYVTILAFNKYKKTVSFIEILEYNIEQFFYVDSISSIIIEANSYNVKTQQVDHELID